MHDYYETLHVSRRADPEIIKAAYHRLAFKHHPDRNPHDASAGKMMKRLNEAWHVLGDPARRSAYDRELAAGTTHQAGHEAAAKREATARRQKAEAAAKAEREAELCGEGIMWLDEFWMDGDGVVRHEKFT